MLLNDELKEGHAKEVATITTDKQEQISKLKAELGKSMELAFGLKKQQKSLEEELKSANQAKSISDTEKEKLLTDTQKKELELTERITEIEQ